MTPLISILVRACNVNRFLPAALQSIARQDYLRWEALILDDASDEDVEGVAAPYLRADRRFRFVRNPIRLGRPGNLNRGLALACGEYIAVLDGDDIWRDITTLTKLATALSTRPEASLVTASAVEVDERGKDIRYFSNGYSSDRAIRERLLIENTIAHNAVCYRKKDVLATGGYNETLRYTEDYELWLRLGLQGKLFKFSDYLASYRIHGANIGIRKRHNQIIEECAVVWRYRYAYPHFWLALMNRLLAFISLCIPKNTRRVLARALRYHAVRMSLID